MRLREAASSDERRRVERTLGIARVALALSALVAIALDPTQPSRFTESAYSLLFVYTAYSVVLLLGLRSRLSISTRFVLLIHGIDLVWSAAIMVFTAGTSSPYFAFYAFVLLAAAHRWGWRETFATAGIAVVALAVQAAFLDRVLEHGTDGVGASAWSFLVMRITFLILVAYLVGALSEREKRRRAESAYVARLLGGARAETGLWWTVAGIFQEASNLLGTRRALLAVRLREDARERAFLWRLERPPGGSKVRGDVTEIGPLEWPSYFFPAASDVWLAVRRAGGSMQRTSFCALAGEPPRLRPCAIEIPGSFAAAHPFGSLACAGFDHRESCSGRLFLFDAAWSARPARELRFVQTLLNQIVPTVYGLYLLHRLRSQAAALERARLGREIHDGAIQSLAEVAMRMEALKIRAGDEGSWLADQLGSLQERLRVEAFNLRLLMDRLRPRETGDGDVVEVVAGMLGRFEQETGIRAAFHPALAEAKLPPRIQSEAVRILQEGLINAHKHSGARSVFVRMGIEDSTLRLVIGDDGRGFGFSGRLELQELERAHRGPAVIMERVKSMGGSLAIDSRPGRGSRLEIDVPLAAARKALAR